MMSPSDIPLCPSTRDKIQTGKLRDVCSNLLQGSPITGADPYNFNGGLVNALTGSCKEFNMCRQEDRDTYAELMARAVAASTKGLPSPLVLWEERIKTPDGGLTIYLCYIESEKTYEKYIK